MSAFIDKSAIWAVKKEVNYGEAVTFDYATDYVEFISPSMDGQIDKIEREVLNNSLVMKQSLLGKETSSGTLPIEVSTTDASGNLNGDVLYESGLGVKIPAVPSEVPTTNTVNTLEVADATAYGIGQGVKVTVDGAPEYRTVVGISGTTLTIAPDFTGTAASAVEGLLSYRLSTPQDDTISLAVKEYLENTAAKESYIYSGNVVNSVNMEFPTASIVKSTFGVTGAEFTAETATDETRKCSDLTPQVAKNMTFTYNGVTYDIEDLSVTVDNDVQPVETATSAGINAMYVVGKEVGGNFTVEYDSKDLFDLYKANTTGALNMVSIASNGKAFGVYAPKVSLSNVTKSIDNSIYKNNVEFECLSSDACIDGVEDALSIWFE